MATAATAAPRVTFKDVLRNGGFRNLWLGQIVSQVGDYFAFLAMMVIVAGFAGDQQGTTLAVAGMTIALSVPRLLFGILAGVFVDRWDRRRTMITSDFLRAGLTLAMIPAFLTQNLLLMYALGFVMSAVGTLFNPAKGALIPRLVPTTQLLAANALSQTSMMLATLVGPALAGISFTLVGSGNQWFAFVIDSVSFLISAFAIWRITVPPAPASNPQSAGLPSPSGRGVGGEGNPQSSGLSAAIRQVGQEYMVGLRALLLNRVVTILTLGAAITMLGVGAINVLFIVWIKVHFGFQAADLAWRVSVIDIVFSIGMIASSVLIGNVFAHVSPKWLIVVGLIGAGTVIAAAPLMPDYWLLVLLMLGAGAFVAPINFAPGTMLQIVVPNKQLGRVGGGVNMVVETASISSMALAGALGALLTIPVVFVIGGVCCLIGGVLSWTLLPALTLKDKVPDPDAAPPTPDAAPDPTNPTNPTDPTPAYPPTTAPAL